MENNMKTIALTCSTEKNNYYLRTRYIKYITSSAEKLGITVLPIVLPITEKTDLIREYARRFDGYLFTGGDDVDPALYGEEKLPQCGDIEPERDVFETALLRELVTLDRPVFGICRGCQIMNTALGGTLWQDFASQKKLEHPHFEKTEDGSKYHRVKAAGFLRDLTESEVIVTNSYHHQSVKDPGNGLEICAYSEDGIVEALNHTSLSFYRAVQWHPEIDPDEISWKLLKSFIEAI